MQALCEAVENATSLNDIDVLLQAQKVDEQVKDSLVKKLTVISFSNQTQEYIENETRALARLVQRFPVLRDAELIGLLLKNNTFTGTIGQHTLYLLSAIIEIKDPKVGENINAWLSRILQGSTIKVISDWKNTVTRLIAEQIYEQYEKEIYLASKVYFKGLQKGNLLKDFIGVGGLHLQDVLIASYRDAILDRQQIDLLQDISMIYPNINNIIAIEKQFLPWQRNTIRSLFFQGMAYINKKEKDDRFSKMKVTHLDVLKSYPDVWLLFTFWFSCHLQLFDQNERMSNPEKAEWEELKNYYQISSDLYENICKTSRTGTVSVGTIERCMSLDPLLFDATFCTIEQNSTKFIRKLFYEIDQLLKLKNEYKEIVDLFMNGSVTHQTITDMDKGWENLRINDIRNYFHSPVISGHPKKPIDDYIYESKSWMYLLVNSDLFQLLWNEENQKGYENENALVPASQSWLKLYDDFTNNQLPFERLIQIGEPLSAHKERVLFSKTARGFRKENNTPKWNIINEDAHWVSNTETIIHEWLHLYAVKRTLPSIIHILSFLHPFVTTKCTDLQDIINAADHLKELFEKEDFNKQTMKDLPRYTMYSNQLDPCLVRLSPELFETIYYCIEVLNWLRESPDDNNFTSSIEEAMGRTEMECPPELWITGKPGRVDEEKLSMLRTVRSYLHDLIFRPDNFNHTKYLFDILRELRPTDQNIISSLKTANEYRLPLMELLNDNNENSAPDRLLQLLLPVKRAEWKCVCSVGRKVVLEGGEAVVAGEEKADQQLQNNELYNKSVGELTLRWFVIRGGKEIEKYQNMNELLDFQSSIVLAKTDQRSGETKEAIDKFIQQFGWLRQLHENLSSLYRVGHFDFQDFTYTFSINEDPSTIRIEAVKTSTILESWESNVKAARFKHYHLNFYCMKHLWRLVSAVNKIQSSDILEDLSVTGEVYIAMQDMLRLVNPDSAQYQNNVIEFIRKFKSVWDNSMSDSKNDASTILELCGEALSVALSEIAPRRRSISTEIKDKVERYPAGATTDSTLHLICAENSQMVYDHIFSAYARRGYLPERENIYICSHSTVWDNLNTLLFRWASSHLHGRGEDQLYAIGYFEILPFDVQSKVVSTIRELLPKAKNTLLLFTGQSENQHIVAQFSFCKTSVIPLPEDVIQEFCGELKDYSQGISVHRSSHAGAGKTFSIRLLASSIGAIHVPFSVMHTNNILPRLKQVYTDNQYSDSEFLLFHIDIYDTTTDGINGIIFELLFLGGLDDSILGEQFFWNPETVSFAFELPAGDLIDKIRICSLLPQREVEINEGTFITKHKILEVGMGEDFKSTRYDGTTLRPEETTNDLANAFIRLWYVCYGLDMMDTLNGKFPYVFEGGKNISLLDSLRASRDSFKSLSHSSGDEEIPLTSERCYQLLMKYSKLDPKSPSLWCLWNFVNVFYWQLRDMHHMESPINCACMPDPTKPDDAARKAKFKGEVVQFLIGTARELATRQIKVRDPNKVVGIFVEGTKDDSWGGFWERTAFSNDGKPVFTFYVRRYQLKLYLYWKATGNKWVIDSTVSTDDSQYTSCKGKNINGKWITIPEWSENREIVIRKMNDPNGYNGEAIQVAGGHAGGGSFTSSENGIYLAQPEYDNVNGKAHYIMRREENGKEIRRHIIYNPDGQGGWQISPTCTADSGAYCMSSTPNVTGMWRSMPPYFTEDKATFTLVTEEQYPEFAKKMPLKYAQAQVRDTFDDLSETIFDQPLENDLSQETLEELFDNTLKWTDSNHQILLFSNENHVVSFLSLDPEVMKKNMHPGLLEHLKTNKIEVGENLNRLSTRFHEVLSALTEVKKTRQEAQAIMDGKYCLTGDSLLKMLAIFARLRCGVPVVLMGECGCGKTMLITYLCAWMGVELIVLDVHGGTTEYDIIHTFERAHKLISEGVRKVFVFLDEINTCSHMGLMSEVICHRSIYGKRIPDGVYVLAALNPYRKRPDRGNTPGLVFQLHGANTTTPDPMASLVYRVHPIPLTLKDFIFDFGSLGADKEKLYIQSMINSKLPNEKRVVQELIAELVHLSQQYIRRVERDPSSASLRDVRRCLNFIPWFLDTVVSETGKKSKLSPLACATVLSLAFVYYYRLADAVDREGYWKELLENKAIDWNSKYRIDEGFAPLKQAGAFLTLLHNIQKNFCSNIEVEEGIAMNLALMENLFVVIICILNKIPIFVVGKPGSSKTLTMQVIASNLQGKQSPRPFWRKYPAIHTFAYQCSPMSDSGSIQHQFDIAVRSQQHAENTITVLLLDEVGLAEHSPDMPLKVLHGMLIDPPIAVVGLSNWVLDPAKMNRAICLQRTEPSENDIRLTGERIVTRSADGSLITSTERESKLQEWLFPLAQAYHSVYTGQMGRDFIGMRDYYNLVKLLRSKLINLEEAMTPELLATSLLRNFGGKKELTDKVLATFFKCCFNINQIEFKLPAVNELIKANLEDLSARHLMLLTKNSAALPIMFGYKLLNERTTKVLIGSEFEDDKNELHLITQINDIKLAMASGSTVVLLNHDNIYEALYDVLNQRYLVKKDQNGKVKKMLRLAIGSRSQLCQVQDGFKIVVIVEQNHAYNKLDLPLLNRFEKQILCAEDILGEKQQKVVDILLDWVKLILKETGMNSYQELFCGYHHGTIPSAVLSYSNYEDDKVDENTVEVLKKWLAKVAKPISVMYSRELSEFTSDYFQYHENFITILNHYILPTGGLGSACIVLTHSPISHLDMVLERFPLANTKSSILQLAELSSERQLYKNLEEFFQSTAEEDLILFVQSDPIGCRQSLINHARYVCIKERAQQEYKQKEFKYRRHVVFLVHLPPGIKERDRQFTLDFISPWSYVFVDDLLPLSNQSMDTSTFINKLCI